MVKNVHVLLLIGGPFQESVTGTCCKLLVNLITVIALAYLIRTLSTQSKKWYKNGRHWSHASNVNLFSPLIPLFIYLFIAPVRALPRRLFAE